MECRQKSEKSFIKQTLQDKHNNPQSTPINIDERDNDSSNEKKVAKLKKTCFISQCFHGPQH